MIPEVAKILASPSRPLLLTALLLMGCGGDDDSPADNTDYRSLMRTFVEDISSWTRERHPGFLIIPQNGVELVSMDDEHPETGDPFYLAAIDGVGQEELFFGYDADDTPTPPSVTEYLLAFLQTVHLNGKQVLVTDYCSTPEFRVQSYTANEQRGWISFAADHRELDDLPAFSDEPHGENGDSVITLDQARNFLYLINPQAFSQKEEYLNSLAACNYDLLLVDALFNGEFLTSAEVEVLRRKPGGAPRLVISYISIGEAENYRYYWNPEWEENPPSWLAGENPHWEGNFKVRYWDPRWQALIFGTEDSYLGHILAAGFDGAYLDIIDAFEYFE